MKCSADIRPRGFTLIELLAALLILSLLALMSYRGLGAVLDAREHVARETEKWRRVAAFIVRFERDVDLVAPRPVRTVAGPAPAWRATPKSRLEFSRFASVEGMDSPRRLAYQLNDRQEVELLLWPGLDIAPGILPARYPVLAGVTVFELQYLDASLAWVDAWPRSATDPPIPLAVRMRLALVSGEEVVRVFGLRS